MDQGKELPRVDRLSRCFELPLECVGQCEIHVIAAEQDVLAHADALDLKVAIFFADRDKAEVSRSAAHVADEDDVSCSYLVSP